MSRFMLVRVVYANIKIKIARINLDITCFTKKKKIIYRFYKIKLSTNK